MKKKWILLLLITISFTSLTAQDALYPNTFPLGDVRITAGPFKHACDLNVKVLLQYDTDRLLAPFLREAGLPKKAETYGNWEKDGLDGHIGGHYLTALAIHYAATGNLECKKRMDYMVSEFARVQQANGDGSICGFPNSKKFAEEIRKGNVGIVWNYWVAWYNMHKTYAGLRDAWLYGKNEKAKKIFLKFCDWGVDVISNLDDRQMERMLDNEFGGMNEVYADAWQMTGNPKYLDTAKRFSHKQIFDSMARRIDNLDNKHANTQVPKAVGYQRVAELNSKTAPDYNDFMTAAEFFWETVVSHRSLSLGGNSRGEHFPEAGKCSLKCDTNYLRRTFSYSYDEKDYRKAAVLDNVYYLCDEGYKKGKRFTGAMIGMYAFAGTYGSEYTDADGRHGTDEYYAMFDYFKYIE